MKLKLEEVAVDSFPTTALASGPAGTVKAHGDDDAFTKWPVYTCPECATPPDTDTCRA